MQLAIVMPAYDELPNLRLLVPEIHRVLEADGLSASVIVVVASVATSDETDEITGLGATVVVRKPTDSFGDAMRTGFSAVPPEATHVVTMDADGSHRPQVIPKLVAQAAHANVVVASRYTHGGSTDNTAMEKAMSRALNLAYGVVLGINCRDLSTNFKLYEKADLDRIELACRDFDVVEEIIVRIKSLHGHSFTIREVPDRFYARASGTTKRRLGPFIVAYLSTLARLRWQTRHTIGRKR